MIFGYYSVIHTCVDIQINIQAGVSMQEHSTMDIRKNIHKNIHVFVGIRGYHPCFYGCKFGCSWISMDIHALTCYGFSTQGPFLQILDH